MVLSASEKRVSYLFEKGLLKGTLNGDSLNGSSLKHIFLKEMGPHTKIHNCKGVSYQVSQCDLRKGSFKINDYEQVARLLLYLLVCFVGLHTKKIHIFTS